MASILIADDQKQIRRLVSKALISDGYHVTTVDDACGAWEQIDECLTGHGVAELPFRRLRQL